MADVAKKKATKKKAEPRRKVKPARKTPARAAPAQRHAGTKSPAAPVAKPAKPSRKTATARAKPAAPARSGQKAHTQKPAAAPPADRIARAKEAATKKLAARKAASRKAARKAAAKADAPVEPGAPARPAVRSRKLGTRDVVRFRKLLLNLRDQVVDEISFLAGENLNNSQREAAGDLSNYGMHMADHGTDSFDRELALSLVSNEQDLIYEIDEALARIEAGTYGICEMTGRPIEKERLRVIPHARYCREAQEEAERGRSRFRPFSQATGRG